MFSKLPDHIKNEIMLFLNKDDFPAAKRVYDRWIGRPVPDRQPLASNV